jgi:hypothetical protein
MRYITYTSSLLFGLFGYAAKATTFPNANQIHLYEDADTDESYNDPNDLSNLLALLTNSKITTQAIGFAGLTPECWKQRAIIIHDISTAKAIELLSDSNASLRITGFMALYYSNYADIDRLKTTLIKDEAIVSTQSGCHFGEDSVSNIIQEIEHWIYRPAIDEFYRKWTTTNQL